MEKEHVDLFLGGLNQLRIVADGTGFKGPQPSELSDREWRADPSDGMRPLLHVRATYKPEAA